MYEVVTAFGRTTITGPAGSSAYQFTGRENDSTGTLNLYNLRARYYSPTLARFTSEDPLGFPGGPDANVYAYVSNNPAGLSDPLGLDPGGCGFLGIGCIIDFFQDNPWAAFGLLLALDTLAIGASFWDLGFLDMRRSWARRISRRRQVGPAGRFRRCPERAEERSQRSLVQTLCHLARSSSLVDPARCWRRLSSST